jgi:hypothetical protein
MRNLLQLLIALWVTLAISQNKQVIYGMADIPQSLLLNPGGKIPQKINIGVPFLSQIHVNGGSSGVTVFDIFGNSDEDINTRIRNKIFELSDKDYFSVTQQMEIMNFGWLAPNKIYYSGGIYEELDFILYFPRDLAILAWDGNRDYLNYEFDLGELSTTGDLLSVYHFGANKQINGNLTVGVRAKLYSSILSYKSTNNRGAFVTTLGDENSPNIYEHTLQNVNVSVETSGLASLQNLDSSAELSKKLISRGIFAGNLGIGIDLGATYDVTDNITASASILDLGAIFHAKDVETYKLSSNYTLDGIELLFPYLQEGEESPPYFEDLEDEIEIEVPLDTLYNSYSQFRPTKINASLAYSFGRSIDGSDSCNCKKPTGATTRNQQAGIQYYSIFRPKGPQLAGTLFYSRRFTNFLAVKATYTVDSFSATNIGFGIVADIGLFNFYLAADNLLSYQNLAKANSVSLQLGLNIKIYRE